VFDNVHGYIRLSEIESRIVRAIVFQRLSRISQLGLASLVYPGANHSRISHSMGAMHVVGRVLDNLALNQPSLECKDKQLLRLAVLLHDLGHFPFSHVLERVMRRNCGDAGRHEAVSSFVLENNKDWEISKIVRGSGVGEDLLNLLKGVYDGFALYGYLIRSDLDVDRLDFLQRDALHTGVAYGWVDAERILRTVTVDNPKDPSFLVIMEKGIPAIENYVFARYHMYNAVYYHKVVMAFELMLERLYELLSDEQDPSEDGKYFLPTFEEIRAMPEEEFMMYDDSYVLARLSRYLKRGKGQIGKELIRMLYGRTPVVEAYSDLAVTETKALKFDKLAGDVATILRNRLAEDSGVDSNWIFVSEPEVKIVKKDDEEAIYVQKNGGYVKLAEDDRSIVKRLAGLAMRGYRVFTKAEYVEALKPAIKALESESA